MHKATIDDVARMAGVSTFTVSQALHHKQHVAKETRQKVLRVAQELDYAPSKSASSLASGRTSRVAILSRDRFAGWFLGELLDGLYDVLRPKNFDITMYRAGSDEERSFFFRQLPTNRNADGLIVTGFSPTHQESLILAKMGIPIVCVNSPGFESAQGRIALDDETGESDAVRYLAEQGHRHFAYVGRADPLTSSQWGYDLRLHGYQDVMTELGLIDCGAFYMDVTDTTSVQKVARQITAQRRGQRPTAICVWSDYYALALIHELHRIGFQVPQDMSIFGFDGSDVASSINLSTMVQPARRMGRMVATMTLDLMTGKQPEQTEIIVPATLRIGETTQAPQ